MSSIIKETDTFHGISVAGRGMFTKYGSTYAGQCRGGYACGLGALTWPNGSKEYAEHGPDGQYDGRCLYRDAYGPTGYFLFERGEQKDFACVYAGGRCGFNGVACAPDDPRLLVLIAQVAPVEVRRTALLPPLARPLAPWRPPSHRLMDAPARFAPAGAGGRRGHRGAAPRLTPSLVAVEHNQTTAALQSTTT
jgi:hypothetical protein